MSRLSTTSEYNGSSWSAGGSLGAASNCKALTGTQTDALLFGRGTDSANPTNTTEKYDGSSWSSSANMVNAKRGGTGASAASAIFTCGDNDTTNQLWNNTSWSTSVECTHNLSSGSESGTTTDAIVAGMVDQSASAETDKCQTLDGTTWSNSAVVTLPAARYGGGWGSGSTEHWHYGGINYNSSYGSPTPHTCLRTTVRWDGSSWSTDTDAPSAGGTSGGLYNGSYAMATVANSGTQGAVYHAGANYTAPDTHTNQEYTWEATW